MITTEREYQMTRRQLEGLEVMLTDLLAQGDAGLPPRIFQAQREAISSVIEELIEEMRVWETRP